MLSMDYPFTPKSTSYLEPGHFWAMPLANGKYSCGVVLPMLKNDEKVDNRVFYAALIDWSSEVLPTAKDVSRRNLIKKGAAHIKTILESGGELLGKYEVENLPPNPTEYTDEIVTMGYNVLTKLIEKKFC
jgi:hypothetical protein